MRLTVVMKPIAALAFIFALITSVSFSQTTPPKPPIAADQETSALMEVAGYISAETLVQDARLKAAANRVASEKVFEFGSVKTKAEIASRRKAVDDYVVTSKSVDAYWDGIETTLRTQFAKSRVSKAEADKFIAGFMNRMNKTQPIKKQYHSAERTAAATAGEVYALLDAEWGNWKADTRGTITFKNKSALDKFNAGVKKMREAIAKQDAAEKQLAAIEQKK